MSTPLHALDGEAFTRLLLQNQRRIAGLIFALVPNGPDADDVMQETCAVLWRKFGEFQPGSDFGAWALRIARFQVMSHYNRRRRAQARLSDEIIETIADTLAELRWESSDRAEALRACVGQLKEREVQLVQRRYDGGESVDEIARHLGATVHAVYKALARLHVRLLGCVNAKLQAPQP
ncbi:MAG: sigma-70 family RNA polymerase sigma factor [Opitutaceae bacterium]|nr:sigma-70 family RNA polymerase sigma factor [Opitutaceae bacterium]